MEDFARSVISARRAHEITVDTIEQVDDDAVVALGRLFVSDERGVKDVRVGWLMFFEDGMLRRSVLVDSVAQVRALLGSDLRVLPSFWLNCAGFRRSGCVARSRTTNLREPVLDLCT